MKKGKRKKENMKEKERRKSSPFQEVESEKIMEVKTFFFFFF
jgi:hypothetical protein